MKNKEEKKRKKGITKTRPYNVVASHKRNTCINSGLDVAYPYLTLLKEGERQDEGEVKGEGEEEEEEVREGGEEAGEQVIEEVKEGEGEQVKEEDKEEEEFKEGGG